MNRYPPSLTYNGLTIVMSNKSRHDLDGIFKGNGGVFFRQECLQPETYLESCDVQFVSEFSKVLPETKCILLLGQLALQTLFTHHDLDEFRGSPFFWCGIPVIASYLPQDACDMQNYEKRFNKDAIDYDGEDESESSDKKENFMAEKGKTKTSRTNWSFWLKQDTKKCLRILDYNGVLPSPPVEYIIQPCSDEVIYLLENIENQDLYFDIETDIDTMDLRCFAFSFSGLSQKVYVVPILDLNYKYAYYNVPNILRALAIAFSRNIVVAHNGCGFDFPLMAYKYNVGIGRNVYDTMVAQQRCFPEVEKSLAHCVSMWTYEPYHKDEGNHTYRSERQAQQLYLYCGKDVYTMRLVKEAQLKYADGMKGLTASISQAQASIRPLMIMSLTGMLYDEELRTSMVKENDGLMEQYIRCMRILTGPKVDPLISNQKCTKYFHDLLGYGVVGKTDKNNPSLSADNLFKLRLKHENPVIDFLLAFRARQAETSKALTFEPWYK